VHEHVSLGSIQKHKERSQIAYATQYPGDIPEFIHISDGKLADMEALDYIPIKPGTFTIMDRGYVDFARLYRFEQRKAFFIVRAKSNLNFRRRYSSQVDKTTGVLCDQTIELTSFYPVREYPHALRRICYFDTEQNRHFVFLANNFDLPALTIAELYRSRWRVELFFKWIKQHLRIKTFYGTDENAVKTQIWIAVSAYLLVAIMKKELNLEHSMYEILQILSITILQKIPVLQVFSDYHDSTKNICPANQLKLFDF
jgi:IS4 transposase